MYSERRQVIYLARNRQNGKAYIGMTVQTLRQRWNGHRFSAEKGSTLPIHSAIRKYGAAAFDWTVLEECATREALPAREQYWIAALGTRCPSGYNVSAGGGGQCGVSPSAATRRKMSLAITGRKHKPEMREKMRQIARNRSPEHLEKIAAKQRGRTHTEAARAKIRAARAKQVFTPEQIARRSASLRAVVHTAASRAKFSAAQKGRPVSTEERTKISRALAALTPAEAAMVKFDALGVTQRKYAKLFGVSVQTINGIAKRRTYAAVSTQDLPADLQCYHLLLS
jgi:group I intron endonuclease